MESFEYNITLLDIFLKAMGEGFPEKVLCCDDYNENLFKQNVYKMKQGYIEWFYEIKECVRSGLLSLVDGIVSGSTKYCEDDGSDKYSNLVFLLWQSLDFFYEEKEVVLSYELAQWLIKSCKKEPCDVPVQDPEHDLESQRIIKEAFRPEYSSALWDVVANGVKNKTFFKWPIESMYKECEKEQVNEVIKYVFGENDGNVTSSFEKLKYESGRRRWSTFDKLFQNERKNDELKKLLEENMLLEKYQVFQSRMIIALFLENLRAILPEKVGKDLTEQIFKLLFLHVKGELIDLKGAFHIQD